MLSTGRMLEKNGSARSLFLRFAMLVAVLLASTAQAWAPSYASSYGASFVRTSALYSTVLPQQSLDNSTVAVERPSPFSQSPGKHKIRVSWDATKSEEESAEEEKPVTVSPARRAPLAPPTQKGGISMYLSELAIHLGGMGRARLAWDCYSIGVDPAHFFGRVIRLGKDDYDSVYNLLPTPRRGQRLGREALQKLASLYPGVGSLEGGVASLSRIRRSTDLTTKLLLKLQDGTEVETVIIPWKGTRSTLCISSQVGCRQGCRFCATGKMGKIRSLTSDEILAQMFFAKKICRIHRLPEITNVVFMGMGEPADNAAAVRTAVKILTDRRLFQLSAGKVTVSTVAPTPEAFAEFADSPCVLAWSVHAASDELRRRLVPTTRHSMVELRRGVIDALLKRPRNFRTTMLEVTLIDHVNDSIKEADELADLARGIVDQVPGSKLIVNLIPCNDIGVPEYRKPSPERVRAFQERLWSHGVYAHVRQTRGDDESAACGQLATSRKVQSMTT